MRDAMKHDRMESRIAYEDLYPRSRRRVTFLNSPYVLTNRLEHLVGHLTFTIRLYSRLPFAGPLVQTEYLICGFLGRYLSDIDMPLATVNWRIKLSWSPQA